MEGIERKAREREREERGQITAKERGEGQKRWKGGKCLDARKGGHASLSPVSWQFGHMNDFFSTSSFEILTQPTKKRRKRENCLNKGSHKKKKEKRVLTMEPVITGIALDHG